MREMDEGKSRGGRCVLTGKDSASARCWGRCLHDGCGMWSPDGWGRCAPVGGVGGLPQMGDVGSLGGGGRGPVDGAGPALCAGQTVAFGWRKPAHETGSEPLLSLV